MKNLKKNDEFLQQKDRNYTKSQKHDVNLKLNSTLFFQVGIILSLLFTFALFEMSFKTDEVVIVEYNDLQEEDLYVYNLPIKIFEETKPIEKKKKEPLVLTNPIISDKDHSISESEVVIEPTTHEPPVDPRNVTVLELPDDLPPMNIMAVEQVPIFPGCEYATTNEQRRQCMSDKIAAHVQKKFNTSIAGDIGLKGEQKIYVMFKIDKNGYVTDIKTSAKQSQLDKEASRVVEKLPQMTPGKQKDKNVEVIYSLPIIFHIIN
jgi:protein TonB